MSSFLSEKEQIIKTLKILYEKDFIQGNTGNISLKVSPNHFLITPRGKRKSDLEPDDILLVDINGGVLEGNLQPSIELRTHLAWYRVRQDINAIIHSHPPYITASSFYMPAEIKPLLTELADFFGKKIVSVPYRKAGSTELEADVAEKGAQDGVYIIILQKHGLLVAGKSLEEALNRTELIEFDTKIKTLKELVI